MQKIKRFTLVELLVVIGIIALLATVLGGTFIRTKQTANKVLCASNLKQLSVGYTFYAKATDGQYPPFAWIMDSNGKLGDNEDKVFAGDPPQGGGSGLTSKLSGGSWLDSSMADIMLCPSDDSPETRVYTNSTNFNFSASDFNNTTSYNQTKKMNGGLVTVESSYGYNLNLGLYEVRMLGLPDPSTMLVNFDADSLLGESMKQNGASKLDLSNMSNIVSNTIELRHLGQANLLWGDGHVSQGSDTDIDNSMLITDNWSTTGNGYLGTPTAVSGGGSGGSGGNGGGNGKGNGK